MSIIVFKLIFTVTPPLKWCIWIKWPNL